jgi:hypothetical protein
MMSADDVFTGTWILNRQKSTFDPNHRARTATMLWERTASGYRMRAEGQIEDGQTVVDHATFVLDGREHPVPAAAGFTASSVQVDANTLRSVGRKDGEVVGEATYAVSPDGTALTATVRGIDAQHRPFQTVIVWDRQ